MERFAHFEDELSKYIGLQVNEETLLGRNYFFIEDGRVKKDLGLHSLPDFELSESIDYGKYYGNVEFEPMDDEEEEITCTRVKAFMASISTQSAWIKCLPPHPADIEVGSAYIVIQLKVDADMKVSSIHVFTRFMDGMNGGFAMGGFFMEVPNSESMECHFSHMPMFPPEVLEELDMLAEGRCFKEGFSFIGKPLPLNVQWMNGGGNTKTMARCSAFHNSYFHLSVDLDENELIESFYYSEYVNEHSMFQRPRSSSDDIVDGLDCALMLLDGYSEDQYQSFAER